jgi:hypothetical protein
MFLPAHYVCDSCRRVLDSEDERYVVRMEGDGEAGDGEALECKIDSDRDYLQEIADLLERGDDFDAPHEDDVDTQIEYHLCAECRVKFLFDALDHPQLQQLDFSNL